MKDRRRSPLRLLAPAALACFALALVVVVSTADVNGGGDSTDARRAQERDLGSTDTAERTSTAEEEEGDELPDDVYVVKEGDTLGAIAERVGISVEKLQQLNPELDPQTLVSGQKIKLRE